MGSPDIWIPVIATAVVTGGLNLLLFAYFMGGVNANIKALKDSVDKLVEVRVQTESRVAVLERRAIDHDDKLAWGTHRFEEVFRSLLALARGDKLPASMYNPPPPP